MKLIKAKSITIKQSNDAVEIRRIDMVNPITGKLPADIPNGDPYEVIFRHAYNASVTLEIYEAITEGDDFDHLIHEGEKYAVTEAKKDCVRGVFDYIKCFRQIINT